MNEYVFRKRFERKELIKQTISKSQQDHATSSECGGRGLGGGGGQREV